MKETEKAELPIIPYDREDDLHNLEISTEADLVVFMAGNQFMAMPELMEKFQGRHPEVRNIYYETLPPGLELKQVLSGGAVFRDDIIDVYPDVYTSVNENVMKTLVNAGHMQTTDYVL